MPPKLSLLETFQPIPDPRQLAKCEHRLVDLLVIAAGTLLCGGVGLNDMELLARTRLDGLKTFLELPGDPPSHDTFNRRFQALNPQAFLAAFVRWVESVRHLISVWACENRLVLGQRQVDDKSNEITAGPALLRALDLAGCLVTADTLHCQKIIAKEISPRPTMCWPLKATRAPCMAKTEATWMTPAGGRGTGRVEHPRQRSWPGGSTALLAERTDRVVADRKKWEGLRSVGVVVTERTVGGKTTMERRCYLSSLPVDVVLREDQSRVRSGHAAQNLALVRKWALNRLRQDTNRLASLRGNRLVAAWDSDFLRQLLTA